MAEVMGEGIGEVFGKKYFGIPFPVILVGVVGIAFVAKHLIASKQQNVESQPATEGYATDVSGNKFASAYTGQAGGVPFGSGSLTSAASSGVAAITPPTEINNEGWLRRATEKLNLLGQWNISEIQTALQTYISGGKLDQRQAAMVQQAVNVEGIPPVNINPGNAVNTNIPHNIVGLIAPANSPAVFAQWDDGSLHLFENSNEFDSVVATNRNLQYGDGTAKIQVIQANDPIWANADWGPNWTKDTYNQQVTSAYNQGNPSWQPYWASSSYIQQHANT
jgi:hypothetical protein